MRTQISINLLMRFCIFESLFSIYTFLAFLVSQKSITLTKILDLSTLVFPENKSWLAKFHASWVPILSTRLRGGTFLKDPAYRRLSIHARREDSKSEALNPRCVCQQRQTGDQQVVLMGNLRVPLAQRWVTIPRPTTQSSRLKSTPPHHPRS